MTFREDLEQRGFDLPEVQELFKCILSAMKGHMSREQIDWVTAKRRRFTLFREVMNA